MTTESESYDARLRAIAERVAKITPEPRRAAPFTVAGRDFIAHAREDIPWLLEQVAQQAKCAREGGVQAAGLEAELARIRAAWASAESETWSAIAVRAEATVARLEAELARLEAETQRSFPLQHDGGPPHPTSIPWSVADTAYSVYVKRHGPGQTLKRLAERGGFGALEMDDLYPGWREEVSEIRRLEAELDAWKTGAMADATGHMHRCAKVNGSWSCAIGCAVAERDALRKALEGVLIQFTPEHLDRVSGTTCGTQARTTLTKGADHV